MNVIMSTSNRFSSSHSFNNSLGSLRICGLTIRRAIMVKSIIRHIDDKITVIIFYLYFSSWPVKA
jgi:hypothetical protein